MRHSHLLLAATYVSCIFGHKSSPSKQSFPSKSVSKAWLHLETGENHTSNLGGSSNNNNEEHHTSDYVGLLNGTEQQTGSATFPLSPTSSAIPWDHLLLPPRPDFSWQCIDALYSVYVEGLYVLATIPDFVEGMSITTTSMVIAIEYTAQLNITSTQPVEGTATVFGPNCAPLEIDFRQNEMETALVEVLTYRGTTTTSTVPHLRMGRYGPLTIRALHHKSPQTSVKVLSASHSLVILSSMRSSNANIETSHVTVSEVPPSSALDSIHTQSNDTTVPPTTTVTATVTATVSVDGTYTTIIDPSLHAGYTETVTTVLSSSPPESTVSSSYTTTISTMSTVPTSSAITQLFVTTKTVVSRQPPCTTATQTIAIVDGSFSEITASDRLFADNTALTLEPTPDAVLYPVDYNVMELTRFIRGLASDNLMTMLMDSSVEDLERMFPQLDWNSARSLAAFIRRADSSIDPKAALRYAVVYLAGSGWPMRLQAASTVTVEVIENSISTSTTYIPLVITTTTITVDVLGNSTYLLTGESTTNQDSTIPPSSRSRSTLLHTPTASVPAMVTTAPVELIYPLPSSSPACNDLLTGGRGKRCRMSICLWDHLKPINITTVIHAIVQDQANDYRPTFGWFAQSTAITDRPHWGTISPGYSYYPLRTSSTLISGQPSAIYLREIPSSSARDSKTLPEHPFCVDEFTCTEICQDHERRHMWYRWMMLAFLILAALLALVALLAVCYLKCFRKKNPSQDGNDRRSSQLPNRQPSNANDNGRVIVTSTSESGQQGSGSGSGEMSEAGTGMNSSASNNGKTRGTLGRSAEEGRAGVDPSQPQRPRNNGGGEEVIVEEVVSPEQVGRLDGASDFRSGHQILGTGSLRGRARLRPQFV